MDNRTIEQIRDNETKLIKELQQKENIIKEVREYITYWHYRNDFRINSFTTGVKEEMQLNDVCENINNKIFNEYCDVISDNLYETLKNQAKEEGILGGLKNGAN